jgi:hypothetical protein
MKDAAQPIWRRAAAVFAAAFLLLPAEASAASLLICRTLDVVTPLKTNLVVPTGSLFRDDGRADDPLAKFTGDVWQLRLETIGPAVFPPLQECARVFVRITSDSSVKSVAAADNRMFVYSGSSELLDPPDASEALLTLKASVIDQVP